MCLVKIPPINLFIVIVIKLHGRKSQIFNPYTCWVICKFFFTKIFNILREKRELLFMLNLLHRQASQNGVQKACFIPIFDSGQVVELIFERVI